MRRPIRFARLEREWITRSSPTVLIATFRRAALARFGAFVDERRIVAGDECGRVPTRNDHPALRGNTACPGLSFWAAPPSETKPEDLRCPGAAFRIV